jgi:hypothetical protein
MDFSFGIWFLGRVSKGLYGWSKKCSAKSASFVAEDNMDDFGSLLQTAHGEA